MKKDAFSMVELMMLLLIASLIVAASVPIITKKHLHLPSAVNHGTYMCYYQDGHLMEARKSGRVNQKMLAGYPRETTKCLFDPPAKASLFQVIVIGGGGGGGDAGYTGSTPTKFTNTENNLSPFGLTESGVKNAKTSVGVADTTAAINEFKSYLGNLWAFAEGANSGRSGTLYYAHATRSSVSHDCPGNKIEYSWVTKYKSSPTSVVLCSGSTGQKTVNATGYGCYKTVTDAGGNPVLQKVGAYVTFGGASASCSKKETYKKCVSPGTYHTCSVQKLDKTIHHDAEYYGSDHTYISGYKDVKKPCANPCLSKNQKNCNSGDCWGKEPIRSNCSSGISACLKKAAYDEPVYKTVTSSCEDPCVNTNATKTITWTENAPENTSWGETSGSGVTCSSEEYDGMVSYKVKEKSGCAVSTTTKKVTYTKQSNVDSYLPGYGAFCTTASVTGNFNLTHTTPHLAPSGSAPDGDPINSSVSLSSPNSFCGVSNAVGQCGTSVGRDYGSTYSEATIGANTIKANSAPKGATGNTLEQTSYTIDEFSSATADAINTVSKTYYYDRVVTSGSNGTNGTCEPASTNKPDCRKSSARVGYCLQHYGQTEAQAEEAGYYTYYDTYEQNSLTKGYDGKPGEFKTIIVRSLNGIDRTITVGRGGSAATLNLGKSGSRGSDTSFGTLISAKGGAGGIGRQPAPEATGKLPKFNKATMPFEKLKACFTGGSVAQADQAQCNAWKADPNSIPFYRNTSGEVGMTPTQTFLGGMFSFVFSHISASGDDVGKDLLENAGKGGTGGGVQHFCWAGQRIVYFEGHELYKTSTYYQGKLPAGKETEIPTNNIIPTTCTTAYENVSASPGYDGAVIITW